MLKSACYIWLSAVLIMNSMVYSVIKVNFTINQKYIIDNFCINKDRPELACDGKCYLAEQIKAEKERQESTPAFTFGQDFGLYIASGKFHFQYPQQETIAIVHQAKEKSFLFEQIGKDIDHPPKG